MDKKKKLNIEEIEQMLDRKLTVAEVYANRPHKWIVYTAIVLIIVTLVGWSAADIKFTGLTATGTEVAKGVLEYRRALSAAANYGHSRAGHAVRRHTGHTLRVPCFLQYHA